MPDDGTLRAWIDTIEAMEAHLAEIRSGLEGTAPMPPPQTVRVPSAPLPPSLERRARTLQGAQQDLEIALRERVGILGAAIHREPEAVRTAISLYIDRRA